MGNKKKQSRRKPGARNYADYSKEMLEVAADLVRNKVISSYEAENQFGIPRRTIVNKSKNIHNKSFGRPTVLSTEEEVHIADVVNLSAEFGCPLTLLDLRIVVYNYILKSGKDHLFNGKMPGERWARAFLQRHNFSQRATQNIKKSRAAKTVEEINEFYKNLETSLKDVPASNILNFDETNLSDDPGSKKCIFKRGTKHPERVINASKSAVSIMFSGTADGYCLPPYVVYKAEHLWTRWCENGPKNARYNRTKSGWFDMMCFDDWFTTIVLPWARSRDGIKLVIGDNLASHLSVDTIQLCQSENIRFVFLPKNATHLTQPLDVAFFGPMKRLWREILTNYKATYSTVSTINKCHFPQLLQELMTKIDMTKETNICKGFEGSGIFSFNPSRVMLKIPTVQEENTQQFDVSLLEFLQRNRRSQPMKTGLNSKLTVVPGKSISTEEAEELAKAKKMKKDTKITKKREKNDSMGTKPGPSKITTVKKKIKYAETQNPGLIDTYELDKGATLEENSTQLHSSSSKLKNPENLRRLCITAINIYLHPLAVDSNEIVHCLKNLPKKSKMNTPFYEDAPECLQPKGVNPEQFKNPNQNKKPKIIITSNIVIKEASPEKGIVLRDITKTQINKRKRRQAGTSQRQSFTIKKKKKLIYQSDSSLTSETSFHAADDSDYENFDNYIASCLQEQEEQENIEQENRCPFGLSDINFHEEGPRLQENSWIIAKFASKKSVKHFIGNVLSTNSHGEICSKSQKC
ncbi:unnamed protein product [Arctia plantaginis]|uniref:DDE-1 domain-containing protein n=1 Tax=Arctia plantaginis TaxID=874455 RepID=A0A8S0ZDV9_ARCPL|nr:unnamed protein product [Arctia plantaginis]